MKKEEEKTEQEIEYVREKDDTFRLDTYGHKIEKDHPRRFEFMYDEDGSMTKDPDLEGDYNVFGESHPQVYEYDVEDWANPCGDYASYGSFGGLYN